MNKEDKMANLATLKDLKAQYDKKCKKLEGERTKLWKDPRRFGNNPEYSQWEKDDEIVRSKQTKVIENRDALEYAIMCIEFIHQTSDFVQRVML